MLAPDNSPPFVVMQGLELQGAKLSIHAAVLLLDSAAPAAAPAQADPAR
jgi:hypothetical protein